MEGILTEGLKQLPALVIFVVFVIYMSKWSITFIRELIVQHREEREVRDVEWRKWLDQSAADTRQFLKDERDLFIKEVNTIMTKHDKNTADHLARLINELRLQSKKFQQVTYENGKK